MNMIQDDEVRLLCPVLASISPGKRYYCRAKIGGEMQLIEVMARTTAYARRSTLMCSATAGQEQFRQRSCLSARK